MPVPTLTAAVVVCAYTEDRMDDIGRAVDSLLCQRRRPTEIVLVIDQNDALLRACTDRFPDVLVTQNKHSRGLSGARNTAVDVTTSDVLLMLDDDAVADPHWVEQMMRPFEDDASVAIVGGRTVAAWDSGRPVWFPPEFDWAVGATYRGIPECMHDVRNPFGGNAGFRREVFSLGGFREGIGRVGDDAAGGEETELTIRYRRVHPQARVVYTPRAVIHHRVRDSRARWGYYLRRCAAEGRSKAHIAAHVGSEQATSRERDYATRILRRAVVESLGEAVRTRRPEPASRAVAIVAGLGAAGWGYVLQTVRARGGHRGA